METSGPIPGEYSLLSIGACLVDDDAKTFSCELKPLNRNADPKVLEVTGLSLDAYFDRGEDSVAAMLRFHDWLVDLAGDDTKLVFVGFNAAFDWSFINYYFHRFVGSKPFGFTALDIKSFYMGAARCSWEDTKSSRMKERLEPRKLGDHNPLHGRPVPGRTFPTREDYKKLTADDTGTLRSVSARGHETV